MKTYYKHNPSRRFVIARSETTWQPLMRLPRFLWSLAMTVLLTLFRIIMNAVWRSLTLPAKLLPHRLIRKLNSTQRLFLNVVIAATILIFGIFIYTSFINPEQTKAAWWDTGWQYRQAVTVTNSNASELTDFQILMTVDTASLITAGKMQSDCDDIRITSQNGDILPYWIETGAKSCNTAATNIWIKVQSLPTTTSILFLYYGNPSATSKADGNKVFEFFDDFSGSSLDTAKWTGDTSNFTVSGGLMTGSNTSYRIQSAKSFSGDYTTIGRSITNTDNVNGYSVIGFYASSSNSFGILDHNNTSYYRNDSSWVNFAIDGTGQWTRNTAKVVGTSATYARVGETSGSSTNSATNSGLSSEKITLGTRYDNNSTGQTYDADWDWILVTKAATTDPTVSFGSEESTPGPVAYWKFDEGSGTTAHDSAGNNNGTISGATWASKDQCVSDKCLQFDGSSGYVSMPNSSSLNATTGLTVEAWIKPTNIANNTNYNIVAKQDWVAKKGYRLALFGYGCSTNCLAFGVGDGSTQTEFVPTGVNINDLGNWHHVVGVFYSGSLKIYVDGTLRGSTTTAVTSILNTSSNLTIGRHTSGGEYFPGFIDEAKVYNYALTPDQILSDYNKGSANVLGASDQSTLSNGLVGYWKMDEASWNGTAGEIKDSSGNGNNFAATDATATIGKFGNGGNFDGADDYIEWASVPTTYKPNIRTKSYWIKPAAFNNNFIYSTIAALSGDGLNPDSGYHRRTYSDINTSGNVIIGFSSYSCTGAGSALNFTLTSQDSLSLNQWNQVTEVIDYTNPSITLYINGKYQGKASNTDYSCSSDENNWWIGRRKTNNDFSGQMDEFRLYNRALSPAEVTQLYHYAPGPVAYYPFEENTGATSVADKSSNNLNLTISGSPSFVAGKYGHAIKFANGSTDSTSLSNALYSLNNYTYGFWFHYDTSNDGSYRQIFSLYGASDRMPGLWRKSDSNCFHAVQDPGNQGLPCIGPTGNNTNWEVGKWYYYSQTKNGTLLTAYVNGSQVATTTVTDPMTTSATPTMYLGKSPSYNAAGITLDEFRLYNYARTPGQIVEDMNAGHPIGGSPIGSQVGYWKFDEGYGTTAHNSGNAGSALDGTINGGATWTDGKFGKALSFDGSNDTVTIPAGDNSALDGENGFTYSVWMKRTEASVSQWPIVIGAGDTHTYYGIRSLSYGDTISLEYGQTPFDGSSYNNISCGSNSLPLNQWHHFTATYDGSRISIYRDTKLCGSGLKVLNSTYPSTFYINTGGFKGLIDEVKVYNAALTADQVKLDYNSGQSLKLGSIGTDASGNPSNTADRAYCPPGDTTASCGPVAEWDFEEGSGTTIYDKSGNGNNGTLTNNPTWTQGKIGKALHFNNSNYALVSPMTGLPTAQITVAAWVKVDLHQNWHNFVNHEWIGNGWLLFSNSSGVPYFGVGQSNIQYSAAGANISTNPWNYLVGTYDGSNVTIYVNGVKGGTVALAGATLDNAGDIYIGSNVKGSIDQVRIYNYALSPAQVAWNYNRGAPVAHYKLDECQGSAVHSSADSYDPLLNGTITIGSGGTQTSVGTCQTSGTAWGNGASGRYGGSLSFDGTDDYFEISQPNIPTSPNSFTVSGWIKPGAQDGFIITPNSNGIDQRIGYDTDSQRLHVSIATAGDTNNAEVNSTTNSVPNTGVWTYFAVSINNRDVKIYINGKLNSSLTHGYDIGGWTGNWRIGQRGNSTYWYKGQMDDLQIFNYVLTSQQVKSLYNNSSAIYFGP